MKNDITKEIIYEDENSTLSQKWKLGPEQENGWKNIIHDSTGLYLTTKLIGKISVLTIEDKGILLIF